MNAAPARPRARGTVLALRIALVLVAGRLLLAALVPFAVERVAHGRGFDIAWSRFRVHYLRAAIEIDGLAVSSRDGERAPWFMAETVRCDLALRDLMSGDVRVQRAELGGARLVAERRADGTMPALDALIAAAASEEEAAPRRIEPKSFASPVRVDALRIEQLRVDVRDARTAPHVVDVDVRADDLGYTDRRGRVEIHASSPTLVTSLRATVELETRADDAVVDATLRVHGLRNAQLAPWIAELAGTLGLTTDGRVDALDLAGRVEARLRVDGSARDGIAGSIALLDASATSRGAESVLARVARAAVDVKSLRLLGVRLGYVEVENGALAVRNEADGALSALGFTLRGGTSASSTEPNASALPFDVAVDAIEARDLALELRDETFEPEAVVRAVLDHARVTSIDTRGAGGAPIGIDVAGSIEGIAARFGARGTIAAFTPHKGVEFALEGSGIRLDALAPRLRELGIESTVADGTFSARVLGSGRATPSGGVEGDLHVLELALADGERLFAVRSIEALGLSLEPATSTYRVRDFAVRGTDVPLRRASDGSFAALGLRTVEARSTRRSASTSAPTSAATDTPPRIEVDRLAIVENRLSWRDERLGDPVEVVFDDCGLHLSNLALFGDPARHGATRATWKAWSRASDVVKDVAISGAITSRPGPLDLSLEMNASASGITARRLQPYIDPTGLEERLQEASLSGVLALDLKSEAGGLRANLELRDASFRNADASVTGAKLVRVTNALVVPDRVDVGAIEVVDGRMDVSRDPVGALLALGFRIPAGAFRRAEPTDAPTDAGSEAERILGELPDVRVGSVRVTNAALAWSDRSIAPPVDAVARLDFALDEFSTRPKAASPYSIVVAVDGSAHEIRVDGEATITPSGAFVDASCKASGLRAGTLASYLPGGIACELERGEFTAGAALSVRPHPAGGTSFYVQANARLAESGAERPLFALDHAELDLARVDPAAQVYEVRRVLARGLEIDARRDVDGRIHALGFVLSESSDGIATEERVLPDFTPNGAPRVVLGELDVGVRRIGFVDEARGTSPVAISAHVTTPSDQVIVDADPSALRPFVVSIEAGVAPLVRSLSLDASIAPWAERPKIRAQFTADGIAGAGVDALASGLSTWIDGSRLVDGVAGGSMTAEFSWKRRSPLDLDLRGGFAADVELARCEFRDAPNGRVLAALDGASAEIARVDPATGDVHVRTLELRKPELRAKRAADGSFEVLGVAIRPDRRPVADVASHEVARPVDVPAADVARPSRGEVRVDELVVRGIDVELRDEAAEPPTVLPLVDLDVLVQRFTTRAFEEPRAIRFDAWLGAGETELPRPARSANVLLGVASAVGGVIEGREEQLELEKRRAFQEAALTGRIQFVPELSGHAQATLSGLELVGLAGTAKHEGVDVGDGTLDASVRVRFRGANDLRVDSELVFSDLSLSEAKSGPIETYLTLPVPLDTALFLLENADGEHRVPVGFTLGTEGLTTSAMTTAAAGAATSVIATAIASAPLRVLSTFTDLFGATGGEEDPPPSAQLAYSAGATELTAEARAALEPLVRELLADSDVVIQVQHRLGAQDVARAERLANPSASDCREIADGLRRRRAELARERAEFAADLRVQWGAGDASAANDATADLRAIDAEAGHVEDALDRILELLEPGAERRRDKRTRSAALAVARQRIEVLRAWLAARGVRDLDTRFEARSPAFEVGAADAPGSVLTVLRERQ